MTTVANRLVGQWQALRSHRVIRSCCDRRLAAQQSSDLQGELQQLRQQYEQTTRDLLQRISALEHQVEDQKAAAASEEKSATQQEKSSVVSTGRTGGRTGHPRPIRPDRREVPGQLPSEPTYDLLREADVKIEKLRNRWPALSSMVIFVRAMV